MDFFKPRSRLLQWLLSAVIAVLGCASYAQGEIVKSPNDPRQYESFQLSNQLQILLVSDPTTDKAAAALDVHVGSGSDPKGREGLAHFLEHMLFLGTEKYPVVGDYKKFITTNGGRVNAYTTFDHTNYFFDVGKEHLEPALDRFAQFFIAPLFPEAYVDREKHAVHSEYKSKLKDDTWNRLRAYKNTVNPQHPFAQFAIGSLDTLSDREDSKVRDELIAFYQQHYSANLMRLVVLGKEPLPQLKQWVTEKFSAVKNSNKSIERPMVSLFDKERLPGRLNIVPIKEQRSLILSFPIPETKQYYTSKPVQHISYLLGHEGTGSLFAFLKAKGWAYGLSAGQGMTLGDESTFDVGLRLTEEGLNHIPEVVSYVFQSIELIKKQGVSEWVHQERVRLANVAFRFQEQSTPIRYVKILAKRMHQYPIQDVLRGPYALDHFAPELIHEYLNKLTTDQLLMTVSAKGLTTAAVDPWFGTQYQLSALPNTLLAQWGNSEIDLALTIPQRNIFLPEDLTVKPLRQTSVKPELIKSSDGFALWYKQDNSFHVPRSDFYASIRSPFANNTPKHAVLTELYVRAVNDQMNEFAYSARLGGLRFRLYKHMRGFALKISGYNDKQAQLLEQVVANLKQPSISPARFALLKNELIRELDNASYKRPYKQILSELTSLLLQDYWDKKQQRLALETVEQVDLENFIPQLLDNINIVGLAHGNVYPEEVLAVADSLKQLLLEENKPGIVPVSQVTKLTQGESQVRQVAIDHGDSAISVYFQGSNTSFSHRAKFKLLAYILSSPFFQDLRTEKQLGYVVFSSTLPIMKVPGIVFTVQSPSADPVLLENSVEEFLTNYAANIIAMTDEDFERYKQGLLTRIVFKEKSLSERTARYWTEVNNGYHEFDSRDQLAEAIKNVTKKDFQQAYYHYLLSDARKRLVVRSFGKEMQKTFSKKNMQVKDQQEEKVLSREI
jgi:secreted Zn-dependent insulinase-like peptidase